MIWLFKPVERPVKIPALDAATEKLEAAREARKSALAQLMQTLEKLPIDFGLESMGKDIGGRHD